MIGSTEVYLTIIVLAVISVVGLAIYKAIKSKLPVWEKTLLILAFFVLNILTAIPFILYHDYFLAKEKRAN